MLTEIDYELLSSEFLRCLRGEQSQLGLSQQLGYSSNVCSKWESGKRFPNAHQTLRIIHCVGIDITSALSVFDVLMSGLLPNFDEADHSYVPMLLSRLQGHKSVTELAKLTGRNRFAVSRFLLGESEPRLPDFFRLIAATCGRLLDWIAVFVNPENMSSAQPHWRRLEAIRALAYSKPWSEGIRVTLALASYRDLPNHKVGWLAATLGISRTIEEDTIHAMQAAGVIQWDGTHWEVAQNPSVDTTRDRNEVYKLKRFWSKTAEQRMDPESDGFFSYIVFATSKKDLVRLRELHRKYFRQVCDIASSTNALEVVAVANVQLFRLDEKILSSGD